jgi:fumarate reductase subunit C
MNTFIIFHILLIVSLNIIAMDITKLRKKWESKQFVDFSENTGNIVLSILSIIG